MPAFPAPTWIKCSKNVNFLFPIQFPVWYWIVKVCMSPNWVSQLSTPFTILWVWIVTSWYRGGEGGEGVTCDCNLWYHQMGSIIGIFSVYLNLITTQTLFFRKSKNSSCWLTVSVKYRQPSRLAEMPSPPIFVLYWESVRFFVATKTRIMLLLVFMFYGKYTTGVWQPSP